MRMIDTAKIDIPTVQLTGQIIDDDKDDDIPNFDKQEFLALVRERYAEAEQALNENHRLALDDIKHINGEHWPQKIREEREKDGRPCLVINRLPQFVDQVVGDARQNRPQIHVEPVDSESDPQIAKIYSGIIMNIQYQSTAPTTYDMTLEQAVRGGFGFMRVLKQYAGDDEFDQELVIKRIKNPFSVYFDPMAIEYDKSDANYCFVVENIRQKEFKQRFPNATAHNFEQSQTGSSYDGWFTNDSVRIAEYWERKPVETTIVQLSNGVVVDKSEATPEKLQEMATINEVGIPVIPTILKERISKSYEIYQYILSGNDILDGPNRWDGKYIPIIPVYGKEIEIDGRTIYISLIRYAKDPQKMYDFWRSCVTESIALAPKAPYLVTPEQIEGHEQMWKTANTKSFPYLLYNASGVGIPARQMPAPVPQGAFTEAQVAVDDIKATIGMYDASLGNRSNETSGKAIMMRQREGDVGTFAFIDNLTRSITHLGRILVDLIPKVYDTERIIRIMGENGSYEKIPINTSQLDNSGYPAILNDITVGKYDVTVRTGPSYTTQRQEAAEGILQFMQYNPAQAPLMADLAAKNMNWPDSDEISRRLYKTLPFELKEPKEGEQPPQPPPPNPELMIEMEKLKIEHEKLELEKMKLQVDIEIERMKLAQSAQQYRQAESAY